MIDVTRGTYIGASDADLLVVRFDVGGPDSLGTGRVSGDIYRGMTASEFNPEFPDTSRYLGTFYSVESVRVGNQGRSFRARGKLAFRGRAGVSTAITCRKIDDQPTGPVELRLRYRSDQLGHPAEFIAQLKFWMSWLRVVKWEFDIVADPTNASRMRTMARDAVQHYHNNGIGLFDTRGNATIAGSEDHAWDEGELYREMTRQFSRHRDVGDKPAWRLHTLAVPWFRDRGSRGRTTGIMFDYRDANQRQGAAVFWKARLAESGGNFQRDFVRTLVHEIGHACNLVHPFRPGTRASIPSASFMNYPARFPGGQDAYWQAFRGRFAPEELDHLLHNRLDAVIMGWAPFVDPRQLGPERADEILPHTSDEVVLELRRKPTNGLSHLLEFGEPVHLEVKLAKNTSAQPIATDALHPSLGDTAYIIERPDGGIEMFQPVMRRDVENRECQLSHDQPAIYEHVDLTHSARGFLFTEPGRYRIQAIYRHDQRPVISKPIVLHVRYPDRDIEAQVVRAWADLLGNHLTFWGTAGTADVIGAVEGLRKCKVLQGKPHPLYLEARRCHIYASMKKHCRIEDDGAGNLRIIEKEPELAKHDMEFLQDELLGVKRNWEFSERKVQLRLPNILYSHMAATCANFLGDGVARERMFDSVQRYLKTQNPNAELPPMEKSKLRARLGDACAVT